MRHTPEEVSRARQTLGQEIAHWTAEIARTQDLREKVALRSKLLECKKKLAALRNKGMRVFWRN